MLNTKCKAIWEIWYIGQKSEVNYTFLLKADLVNFVKFKKEKEMKMKMKTKMKLKSNIMGFLLCIWKFQFFSMYKKKQHPKIAFFML